MLRSGTLEALRAGDSRVVGPHVRLWDPECIQGGCEDRGPGGHWHVRGPDKEMKGIECDTGWEKAEPQRPRAILAVGVAPGDRSGGNVGPRQPLSSGPSVPNLWHGSLSARRAPPAQWGARGEPPKASSPTRPARWWGGWGTSRGGLAGAGGRPRPSPGPIPGQPRSPRAALVGR